MRPTLPFLLAAAALSAGCSDVSEDDWVEVRSGSGRFVVSMPGEPVREDHNEAVSGGRTQVTLLVHSSGDVAYLVSFGDFAEGHLPADEPAEILDRVRDRSVDAPRNRLVYEHRVHNTGYPGREFRIDSADGRLASFARVFLVGSRLYQVMIAMPKERDSTLLVDRFLDSFELQM